MLTFGGRLGEIVVVRNSRTTSTHRWATFFNGEILRAWHGMCDGGSVYSHVANARASEAAMKTVEAENCHSTASRKVESGQGQQRAEISGR